MELKRNILTVLYTILFMLILGLGLFQMTNLTVALAPNRYVVTGIIIFGLIIYLILAFFIKESNMLHIIQGRSAGMIILESVTVLVCLGLFFYLHWMQEGMDCAVIYTLLLSCIYAAARFCGGRFCGISSAIVGFYMLLNLAGTDLVETGSAINSLCFFIPFVVFLGIQRILIPAFRTNGFVIVCAYLVLGFLFALAISLNPLVCLLLAGCIFSLFFASLRGKGEASRLTKGIFSAGLLAVFTIALLFCIQILIPDILAVPDLSLDRNLPLTLQAKTVSYIFTKYSKPIIYLHLPFQYGIFPTLLFFFSLLAGYYGIRKKSSFMGPLFLTQTAAFAYYILFCEGGSQFYELTYMLPVFASYGFTNTLLLDEPVTDQAVEEEQPKEEPVMEEPLVEEPDAEEMDAEELVIEETVATEPIIEELVAEEPSSIPASKEDGIPEWTIPDEFLPDQKASDYLVPEEENDLALETEMTTVPDSESDDSIDLDQLVAEEPFGELLSHEEESTDMEQFLTSGSEESEDGMLVVPDTKEDEETQLHDLLDRLAMSEPIQRMNESAQEDIADVIEREEEQVELSEALPLKPSKSTLPKYKKPSFDFEIEPVSIPLDDQYSNISEYDEVPTVHDLENQWKEDAKPVIETVATKVEEEPVHSEEVVRKNGIGKRSYHKITIR